jgi:hypothetical protein
MGPVLFVFDVSDTEPLPDAPALPKHVTCPFEVRGGEIGSELERTIENAKRDGIRVSLQSAGSQSAGRIGSAKCRATMEFEVRRVPMRETIQIPVRYELLLNSSHSREAQYATLVHELAHLYCGHVGTPNANWWPDRSHLDPALCEFEAESISYLICQRRGVDNPSEQYLADYMEDNSSIPEISLECVMSAAGLIEKMSLERLKRRKKTSQ